MNATATSSIRAYDSKPIVGFKVTGTIKRSDYDISKDTPEAMLSDEVQIKGNFIFVKE